jgi:hypothetical protein
MLFEYDPTATLEGRERLTERAQALRQALLPLREYIRRRASTLPIDSPYAAKTFEHLRELETAFRAIADYDNAVEELVAIHLPRQKQAEAQEVLAEREADPVYRLGYVRGYRRGMSVSQEAHERVLSLYARHAILIPPPGYTPSPLVTRMQRFLGTLTERYGPLADPTSPAQQAA